ncbi:hypothetical protein GCM10027187_55480 [Streptosporangium sandarakinum]
MVRLSVVRAIGAHVGVAHVGVVRVSGSAAPGEVSGEAVPAGSTRRSMASGGLCPPPRLS